MSDPRAVDAGTIGVRSRWLAAGILGVLLAALPGAGGARPDVLVVWHGALTLLVAGVVLVGAAARADGGSSGAEYGSETRSGGIETAPLAALAFFGVWALLGVWIAPYRYAAFLGLLELAAFAAVAWLASRCGPGFVGVSGLALLVPAVAETGLAVVQRLREPGVRPAGTFENTNHLAAWLVAVLLLNLGWLVARDGSRDRVIRVTALPVLLVGVLLSGSRGALLGLAAGLLVLAPRGWRALSARGRGVALVLLTLVVVVVGITQWRRLSETDPFRYHRVRIWTHSYEAVVDHPWTGTGPRQFVAAARNLAFPDGEGPLRYDRAFSRTHSDPLRALCELGWPGVLALLAGAAASALALRRRLRRPQTAAAALAASAALAGLAGHALVDNLSERPALYLTAGALLGAALATPAARGAWPGSRAAASIVTLAIVTLFLVGDLGPYLAWRDLQRLPPGRLDVTELVRLERAIRRNPLHPEPRLRLAQHHAGEGVDWDLGRYALAREAAEHAVRLQPADARYRAGLARLEQLAARTLFPGDANARRRAAERYREAEARSEHDPFLPLQRAAFLLAVGDAPGARRAAERALTIEPNAVPARLLLAEALLVDGGATAVEPARRLLSEAREIARRWADYRPENVESAVLLRLDERGAERIASQLQRFRAGP